MESLYTKFSTHEVLRAVTCLAIHDNIVVPIDVVHTTIELYSWLWTFAPPRQCDPSMPDLTIDGDEFRRHDPEMLIDSSGTVAHHVVTNNNSIVLVTPNFTVEDVITGRVPPCRLRFPFHEQQFSHYVFVYVEGTESSPAIEYSTYTDIGAVVADVSITKDAMLTFDVVTHDIHDSIENAVIPSGNMGDGSICQSCDVLHRLPATTRVWFGIYTFSAAATVFLQDL